MSRIRSSTVSSHSKSCNLRDLFLWQHPASRQQLLPSGCNLAPALALSRHHSCRLKRARRVVSIADDMETGPRKKPNILVTGTPGTGKTTTCEQLVAALGFAHINVGEQVKQQELHSGWNAEHQAYMLDEDKVCDALEDQLEAGGCVVDHHGCDLFPERWFDLVVVLQTSNDLLYVRLEQRGYPPKKITENLECEIMHVIVEEARESYREEVVQVLSSNTVEEMDANVERIVLWVKQFMALR